MNTVRRSCFCRSVLSLFSAERDCRGVFGRGGRHVSPFLAVAAMLVVVGGLCRPADAQVVMWDFTSTSGSWTRQNVAQVGPPPVNPKWEYGATLLSGTRWSVSSGNTPATGNYLTSPLINLDVPADKFTFTMAHRYRFKSDDDKDDKDDKDDNDEAEISRIIDAEYGQLSPEELADMEEQCDEAEFYDEFAREQERLDEIICLYCNENTCHSIDDMMCCHCGKPFN